MRCNALPPAPPWYARPAAADASAPPLSRTQPATSHHTMATNPYAERPKTNYTLPVALTLGLACVLLLVRTGQEVQDKHALQGLLASREVMLAQGLSEAQREATEIATFKDHEKSDIEGALIDADEKRRDKEKAAMQKEMTLEATGQKDSQDVAEFKLLEKQQEMDDKKWAQRMAAQKAIEADLRRQLAAAKAASAA